MGRIPVVGGELAVGAAKPPRLLVVDDEPGMLRLAHLLLQEEFPHAHVVTAESAEKGLEALARGGIDLVVSDFRMPGMDGIEFLTRASGVPARRRILLTALSDPGLRERALAAGISTFVPKALGPGELLEAVRRALHEAD